tara:strand:- start:867 stop:1697 length:831 start_codon:yes stop_codon:yes gene_type:complete
MAKFKHNKKRNTAFIYESLVVELTKAVLSNDKKQQTIIKKVIKEHFSKNSALVKDLRIYQAITTSRGISASTAEKIITEAKNQKSAIDSKELFNEQNALLESVNKFLPLSFFSNFIPNYKNLASVCQIFNSSVPIKSRVLLEQEIIDFMSSDLTSEKEMLPIDSLTYKVFAEKFNKEYKEGLLGEQRELLEKYITSFKDNGLELKMYLEEEIGRLKNSIQIIISENTLEDDDAHKVKLAQVGEILNKFAQEPPNENMLKKVISIQSLVHEIQNNVD